MRKTRNSQDPCDDGAVGSVAAKDGVEVAVPGCAASAAGCIRTPEAPCRAHLSSDGSPAPEAATVAPAAPGLLKSLTDACRLPVVARFLESLPSPRIATSWSLPSIHSIPADAANDLRPEEATASSAAAHHTRATASHRHHTLDADLDSASIASDEAESRLQGPQDALQPHHHHHAGSWSRVTGCGNDGGSHSRSSSPCRPRLLWPQPGALSTSPVPLTSASLAAAAAAAAGRDAAYEAPGSTQDVAKRGVFVGNLPSTVSERQLVQIFSKCGPLVCCWVVRDARNQASLGYGYVVYDAAADADAHRRAQHTLDGACILDQPIVVRQSTRTF